MIYNLRRTTPVAILQISILSSVYGLGQTGSQTPSTRAGLAGTSWQLVKFQSSDEKTLTPDERSKYTISFGNDGRASVRLDCNRGSGTYESNGPNQLQFGRFALTLMMCPPGSLHTRIARDLMAVRSYVIKDGHLFLSLMIQGAPLKILKLSTADEFVVWS